MKWITRENAKVDRIACPWLIRRFIDEEAEFIFAPKGDVMRRADAEGAVPFDMPGVKFGHTEGNCSFENIVAHHGLTKDPGLRRLSLIVHAADVPADDAAAREGAGLRAIAEGFALVHGAADHKKMELEFPLYDALYAWCSAHAEVGAA
jgi:hypothetical protein